MTRENIRYDNLVKRLIDERDEAEDERDRYREVLERIYRLPCQHPDDPNEDRKLARQFAKAQRLADAAIHTRPGS
jgi:hypothetical protein